MGYTHACAPTRRQVEGWIETAVVFVGMLCLLGIILIGMPCLLLLSLPFVPLLACALGCVCAYKACAYTTRTVYRGLAKPLVFMATQLRTSSTKKTDKST
eukprot:GDKI01047237.1.p2 GENE.GDKI01047237.1~~GDKI01047237.1.p2  ORF type:complete len:109 (-),score=23.55 GDKI01047237.1:504-803(-)